MISEIKNTYRYQEILPGLCHIPGGEEYYRQQIITYTSYKLSPEELHKIGYSNLEITQEKIRKIIRQLGMDYDLKEFQNYLQKNHICYDNTPQELQHRFDSVQSKIEPKIEDFFLRRPKSGCPVPGTSFK